MSGSRSSTARLIGLAASHWVNLAASQRVGESKPPPPPLGVKARAVHDEPACEPADHGQRVDDLNLGTGGLLLDPVGQDPGGEIVALADRGAEDQDAWRQQGDQSLGGSFIRRISGPMNHSPAKAIPKTDVLIAAVAPPKR